MTNSAMVLRLIGVLRTRCVVLGSGFAVVSGCVVTDAEMFSQSNAALVENSGEPCDLVSVGRNETVVDENNPYCAPGYCVGKGDEPWTQDDHGICTCRCDGPHGTGPLCDCADGYHCKEMIKDVGLDNLYLVGSYCVPRE